MSNTMSAVLLNRVAVGLCNYKSVHFGVRMVPAEAERPLFQLRYHTMFLSQNDRNLDFSFNFLRGGDN